MDQIIIIIKHLCGNLRFSDGRSLEDVLKEQKLRKNLKKDGDKTSSEDSYGDEIEEEGESEMEEGSESEDDGSSSLYDEIEEEERQKIKEGLDSDQLEVVVAAEADQKNKRDRFRQHLQGVDDDEKSRVL
jgi:hypothetical protein